MTRTDRTRIGTSERSLSLVVSLRDAFTADRPGGSPHVTLAGRPERFTRNRSGYHVLTDLPEDVSSVTVEIDPGDRYLPERRVLDDDDRSSRPLRADIDLLPSPAYRFPADATLVRGTVGEANDGRIETTFPDVELSVAGAAAGDETGGDSTDFVAMGRSDGDGEYVLFFRGLTADDVQAGYDNGHGSEPTRGRVVHVDGGKPVIRAVHRETTRETTASVAVKVGETTSLDIEF